MLEALQLKKFDSIPRLYRNVTITEKIDGMNCGIHILKADKYMSSSESGALFSICIDGQWWHVSAQSRRALLYFDSDQHGFAAWVFQHARELIALLGEGSHYGEWWGKGIERSYHQSRNYFSLFNTKFWNRENTKHIDGLQVVPVLYDGPYDDRVNYYALEQLRINGSIAAQEVDARKLDFRAEGIVGWHQALNQYYKVTLNGDGHKGAAKLAAEATAAKNSNYSEFFNLLKENNDPPA